MLLSDRDICAQVEAGQIALDPWDPAMVQPSSVDVHLDRFFRLFDNHRYSVIDPAADQSDLTRLIEVDPDKPFVLHPGEFVLGSTFELVSLGDCVAARLEGKSSLGRLGLLTHSTAGFIDPGFTGHITLELSNTATMPILLWPGMKVGQLCFFQLTSASLAPYGQGAQGSRYQGQRGPTASRSHLNFSRADVSRGYVPPAGKPAAAAPFHVPDAAPPALAAPAAAPPAGKPAGKPAAAAPFHVPDAAPPALAAAAPFHVPDAAPPALAAPPAVPPAATPGASPAAAPTAAPAPEA